MLTAFEKGTKKLIFSSKGVFAICPDCGKELIPKCGKINTPHFSHLPKEACKYSYHDSKSEWHYSWQLKIDNPTPGVNIEVVIKSGETSKRADVVTKEGVVIEFQKSSLPIQERILREQQYGNMIWVIHRNIENSKTWKNSKNIILIDYGNNELCLYGSRDYFSKIHKHCIGKKCFIDMIMNGTVAYPKIFLDIVKRKQNMRSNNKIYNAIKNIKILHGNNNVKDELGSLFKFYNNGNTLSGELFNNF